MIASQTRLYELLCGKDIYFACNSQPKMIEITCFIINMGVLRYRTTLLSFSEVVRGDENCLFRFLMLARYRSCTFKGTCSCIMFRRNE
jgi:hypothetical protein